MNNVDLLKCNGEILHILPIELQQIFLELVEESDERYLQKGT